MSIRSGLRYGINSKLYMVMTIRYELYPCNNRQYSTANLLQEVYINYNSIFYYMRVISCIVNWSFPTSVQYHEL